MEGSLLCRSTPMCRSYNAGLAHLSNMVRLDHTAAPPQQYRQCRPTQTRPPPSEKLAVFCCQVSQKSSTVHHSPNSDSSKKRQYLLRDPTSAPPLHHHNVLWRRVLASARYDTLMPFDALCDQLLHSLAQTLYSSQYYTMSATTCSAYVSWHRGMHLLHLRLSDKLLRLLALLARSCRGHTPKHADKTLREAISRLSSKNYARNLTETPVGDTSQSTSTATESNGGQADIGIYEKSPIV